MIEQLKPKNLRKTISKIKLIYLRFAFLKSIAISMILTTLIDYFSNVDSILFLLIFIGICLIIFLSDRKKIKNKLAKNIYKLSDNKIIEENNTIKIIDTDDLNQLPYNSTFLLESNNSKFLNNKFRGLYLIGDNVSADTLKSVRSENRLLRNYNFVFVLIFLVSLSFKLIIFNLFEKQFINPNIQVLTQIILIDSIIIPDSLPYLFVKNDYYPVSKIDNYNVINNKFKEKDIVHIYYRFRLFSRIYIYSYNFDNTKENDQFTNRLNYGFYKYREENNKIIIQQRRRKFIFENYKPSAQH